MNLKDNLYLIFLLLFVLSIFLIKIPVIGKFIRIINTLFHETGHAIMALLFNSEIYRIELLKDTSGLIKINGASKFSTFFIALAGYPFVAIMSYLFLYLLKLELYLVILYLILFVAIINITFWVRNVYGIIWIILFSALSVLVIYNENDLIIAIFTITISCIMLIETFISNYNLIKIAYKSPGNAGDATLLKSSTYIPSILWALLFLFFSLYFAYLSLKLFL